MLTFASAFENKRKLSCSGHTRKSSLNRLHKQSSSARSCLSWRVIRGAWWRQGKDEPKIQSRCFKLQDGASCDRQNKPLALLGENLRSEYFERNIKILLQFLEQREKGELACHSESWQGCKRYFYNGEFDPGSGWTLATGLTHASRGAACIWLARYDGDRRTGE